MATRDFVLAGFKLPKERNIPPPLKLFVAQRIGTEQGLSCSLLFFIPSGPILSCSLLFFIPSGPILSCSLLFFIPSGPILSCSSFFVDCFGSSCCLDPISLGPHSKQRLLACPLRLASLPQLFTSQPLVQAPPL